MPGMSGLRTALLLSQMAPTLEVILMSMDTSAEYRAACAGCGAKAVIYKPRFLREAQRIAGTTAPERQNACTRRIPSCRLMKQTYN
jgi:Response regulator containing a CheY-like receiver domain and an HTH DNA-binding domain